LILKIKTVEMLKRHRFRSGKTQMAKVDGIVLDVRDDGGGSLSTVVDIAGLFSKALLCKSNQQEVLYDRDKKLSGMVH
jgi:C-terminal processing protease CtpA/Prc